MFEPESLAGAPWLEDLLDVPADFAWPRYMSPPHPDAVGSYGAGVEAWVEEHLGVRWRHWLRLATRRQLEHDAEGRLCWRTVLESTPRRSGKSTRQRGVATWRLAHPELFGEPQLVLHTGADVAICREIQRGIWRWAEDVAGWTVTRSNGKEAVETPAGDRWLVRSQLGVFGYDATLALVDEAWNVAPGTVDEGLEPSILERLMPQLWMVSTAHRRATPLMRRRLTTAIAGLGEDWKTLLMLWGCGPDDDIGDPEVWRAANPYWSPDRADLIADRYERAQRGEALEEADDPDPMSGFACQYLNRWPPGVVKPPKGEPLVEAADWEALNGYEPAAPTVGAVEAWFRQGAALVLAEPLGDGTVGISAASYPSADDAVAAAREAGATTLLVGKTLAKGLPDVEPATGTVRQAVLDLRRSIDEGIVRHDGSELLTTQVLGTRVSQSADGPRVVSDGRADALKAAAWALEELRVAAEAPAIF